MDVVRRLLSRLSPPSRFSCHHPNTPPPSVLTFLYNLSLYTYTRVQSWVRISQRLWVCLSSTSVPREANAVLGKMFGNKEMRLLMLGLDAAGKTSAHPRFSSTVGVF